MTSEDIEKAVQDLELGLICRDDFDPEDLFEVRRDISSAMRSLVSQAYEEAARAICHMCESGSVPATKCDDHGYEHIYPEDPEDGYAAAERCHAADIHALKDSLVLEPVASR